MKPLSMILVLTANIFCGVAQAGELPGGGVVAVGSASIAAGANAMVVNQGSNRAVINWNSFSVGAGNTVQFVQPSSSAAALNRVLGANPSQIYGQITANGQVFLVNPNGITVGPGGRIDASGIFLSTANMTDADFLAGSLRFETPPAETRIVIAGTLDSAGLLDIRTGSLDVSGLVASKGDMNIDVAGNLVVTGNSAVPAMIRSDGNQNILVGGNLSLWSDPLIPGASATITALSNPGSGIEFGNVLAVANSNVAINNWSTLSIASGESTRLTQSASSSTVFNRRTNDPTTIYGTLSTNGRVWLINPSGIHVGAAGRVNVPALVSAIGASRRTGLPSGQGMPTAATSTSLPAIPGVSAAASVHAVGLVDGAVTVRLSLVDAAPISLR